MCEVTGQGSQYLVAAIVALLVLCSAVGAMLYHGAIAVVERLAAVIACWIKARRHQHSVSLTRNEK